MEKLILILSHLFTNIPVSRGVPGTKRFPNSKVFLDPLPKDIQKLVGQYNMNVAETFLDSLGDKWEEEEILPLSGFRLKNSGSELSGQLFDHLEANALPVQPVQGPIFSLSGKTIRGVDVLEQSLVFPFRNGVICDTE